VPRPENPQQKVSVGLIHWTSPLLFFLVVAGGAATMTWTLLSGLTRALAEVFAREQDLAALNSGLEEKVKERTAQLEAMHSATQEDLILASRTQQSILNQDIREIGAWNAAVIYRPSHVVSGDVYDFYYQKDRLMGLSLFDISGHGVSSALLTMMVRSIARQVFFEGSQKPLGHVMDEINRRLIQELDDIDHHLTGILLRFNEGDSPTMEYVNAGHPEMLLRRKNATAMEPFARESIDDYGSILGYSMLARKHKQLTLTLHKGDQLLLYTDGLTDVNPTLEESSLRTDLLIDSFTSLAADRGTRHALEDLFHVMTATGEDTPLPDDCTILLLEKQ
jgi:sigma-B regulation protein RsbU (phosphoserine phosphatase)